MTDAELTGKFRTLTRDLPVRRVRAIEQAVDTLDTAPDALSTLLEAVTAPLSPDTLGA